jgi:hypothetical protein
MATRLDWLPRVNRSDGMIYTDGITRHASDKIRIVTK